MHYGSQSGKIIAEGGYLKLWIPESPNADELKRLREIIRNEEILREIFNGMMI